MSLELEYNINYLLFGQHLIEGIVHAINGHWNSQNKIHKPLVLSFHGTTGVGKKHLTNLIAKSFFKLGSKSKYAHDFSTQIDFQSHLDLNTYRVNLFLFQ